MAFLLGLIILGICVYIVILVAKNINGNFDFGNTGNDGEKFVSNKLNQLDPLYYKILDDILLPSNNEIKTSQIDHIVVSNFGIFCIETKDYSGWIFGKANEKYWTQVIYNKKSRFYNPIRQNYGHVKAIEDLIYKSYPNIKVLSFVVFPNADKLKITGTNSVACAGDTVNKIKTFNAQLLSEAEKDDIYSIISNANILDENIRRRHIEKAKEIKRKIGIDEYNEKNNYKPEKDDEEGRYSKRGNRDNDDYEDDEDGDYDLDDDYEDDYDDEDYDDDYED